MKLKNDKKENEKDRSPPARGAWIETCRMPAWNWRIWSPPARGAWIETWADLPRATAT